MVCTVQMCLAAVCRVVPFAGKRSSLLLLLLAAASTALLTPKTCMQAWRFPTRRMPHPAVTSPHHHPTPPPAMSLPFSGHRASTAGATATADNVFLDALLREASSSVGRSRRWGVALPRAVLSWFIRRQAAPPGSAASALANALRAPPPSSRRVCLCLLGFESWCAVFVCLQTIIVRRFCVCHPPEAIFVLNKGE